MHTYQCISFSAYHSWTICTAKHTFFCPTTVIEKRKLAQSAQYLLNQLKKVTLRAIKKRFKQIFQQITLLNFLNLLSLLDLLVPSKVNTVQLSKLTRNSCLPYYTVYITTAYPTESTMSCTLFGSHLPNLDKPMTCDPALWVLTRPKYGNPYPYLKKNTPKTLQVTCTHCYPLATMRSDISI